ncbi:MAG: hypothetical protein H5U19_01960 [Rhodobacteraceae bacterium]|nr:hypothetical protein [Paracoccaceae bacterium]
MTDGRVEIDNNRVENLIRPIAKRVSLPTLSSSVCKHLRCIRIGRRGYREHAERMLRGALSRFCLAR